VETNLFFAPGEGSIEPEDGDGGAGASGNGDAGIPDAIRLLRDRNNA
jgi:hypothetical protein